MKIRKNNNINDIINLNEYIILFKIIQILLIIEILIKININQMIYAILIIKIQHINFYNNTHDFYNSTLSNSSPEDLYTDYSSENDIIQNENNLINSNNNGE